MLAVSTLRVVAVGIALLSSVALWFDTSDLSGAPPPQSPPIITLPPPSRPEASMVAPASSMCSPVIVTVPPLVPAFLPAAESVPETFTFCGGRELDAMAVCPRCAGPEEA